MRTLILIFLLMLLAPLSSFSQGVKISVSTQSSWPPGEFVPVVIEIGNPGRDGFARFYQDLPRGFSVRAGATSGADFYWENNQVNFVWLKLPADKVIRFSYLARADESLSGSFRLGGSLNYVTEDNERMSVNAEPLLIKLDKDAKVDADPEDFEIKESQPAIAKEEEREVKEGKINIEFRVQVAISSEELSKTQLETRINCPLRHALTILRTGNMYKYQSGSFSIYPEASVYLDELKGRGVEDAFIVAYRGDEQISISLARTLTE